MTSKKNKYFYFVFYKTKECTAVSSVSTLKYSNPSFIA